MPRSHDDLIISIEEDGRTVASAEVHPSGHPGVVHSDLHVESGHVRAWRMLLDDATDRAAGRPTG